MAIIRTNYIELDGYINCQSCCNKFPKEFADRCLGWWGGAEQYTVSELQTAFGTTWKNYDTKGQWYWWKNGFICPECAKKLIDNGEAQVVTAYNEYFTTCDYNKLSEDEKKYATPCEIGGSEVKIPYNILTKKYKRRKRA